MPATLDHSVTRRCFDSHLPQSCSPSPSQTHPYIPYLSENPTHPSALAVLLPRPSLSLGSAICVHYLPFLPLQLVPPLAGLLRHWDIWHLNGFRPGLAHVLPAIIPVLPRLVNRSPPAPTADFVPCLVQCCSGDLPPRRCLLPGPCHSHPVSVESCRLKTTGSRIASMIRFGSQKGTKAAALPLHAVPHISPSPPHHHHCTREGGLRTRLCKPPDIHPFCLTVHWTISYASA